jgi:osmotically-inducible protein OsmY
MNSRFLIGALGFALGVGLAGGAHAEDPATTAAAHDNSVQPDSVQPDSVQPGTDAWITTKVKAELMTAKDVRGTAISVSTMNGIVTLAGIVDNKEQVQKSVALAKAIKGVRGVDSTALNSRN